MGGLGIALSESGRLLIRTSFLEGLFSGSLGLQQYFSSVSVHCEGESRLVILLRHQSYLVHLVDR